MKALLLAVLLPSVPAPMPRTAAVPRAAAKKQPARKLSPEENPKLGGASRAFAKARIRFETPAEREEVQPGDVTVRLTITGYALVGGAHAHLIVDNEAALQVDDVTRPLTLKGIAPGPHLLRAVLCRPWHEVVKAPRAFAMVRFWSWARTPGRPGAVAEQQVWPAPRRPLLTYVLPLGEPAADAPRFESDGPAPAAAPQGNAATAFTSISTDPNLGESSTTAPPPPPPPPAPLPQQPPRASPRPRHAALDFYLSNAKLGKRSYKIRVVLDRAELQLVKSWEPRRLPRLRPGVHYISIDLLDRLALKVRGALNRTDRRFRVP